MIVYSILHQVWYILHGTTRYMLAYVTSISILPVNASHVKLFQLVTLCYLT